MPNYSQNFLKIIENAKLASDGIVTPNNLITGIINTPDSKAARILTYLGIGQKLDSSESVKKPNEKYVLTSFTNVIIQQAELEATYYSSKTINSEHLILAIVRKSAISGIELKDVQLVLQKISEDSDKSDENDENSDFTNPTSSKDKGVLEKFCINLNEQAKLGKLDPIIGREKEMRRIEQVLSRRKKNNPVLIGEAGVGKTAIVEGLAQRIVNHTSCDALWNKRILIMDMSSIVAGTKFRGEFEERLKKIIDEIIKDGNYIVYVDEIHTIVGAGSSAGSLDAANILKPALSRGQFSCIGSTTLKEYRQIEKDGALERRFQKVMINEPTLLETKSILYSLKGKYETFHGVSYSDEIITECLNLSNRYLYERKFPDKAIDIMDEVGSAVKIRKAKSTKVSKVEKELDDVCNAKLESVKNQDFESASKFREMEKEIRVRLEKLQGEAKLVKIDVTKEDVYDVISTMTGIPSKSVTEDELSKFVELEKNIKEVFVGQDEAVDKVTRSLIRNKAGLGNTNKPIGVFLFTGKTGVGKTFLAKLLAKNLFNSEEDVIRIDMSEYMEKASVSRLIGASPGYIGYEEGGQLTEKVRRKPYSIVLLDEIEKAHSDVWNILLQVFDDGLLTDAQGKTVSFKNTIIIMTSNVGSKAASQFGTPVGFNPTSVDNSSSIVEKEIAKLFAPEFLNRIDDIVKFNPLVKEDIKNIIKIELKSFSNRLMDSNNMFIKFDAKVEDFIFEKGWDEKLGARPIKRAIQKLVEDEISMLILSKKVKSGDSIIAKYNAGDTVITFTVKSDKSLIVKKQKDEIPT